VTRGIASFHPIAPIIDFLLCLVLCIPVLRLDLALQLFAIAVDLGSPALGSTPSGPVTPNRSNSEIFPPSRLAPRPGGSIPDPGASTSTTTPSNQSGATQNGSGTNGSNTQDPATAGSGRVPSPATGGAGGSTKTGKNPALDTVADCMKIWDAGTHMSKADWARTCRRVQGRLDDLKGASERQ
jgi:hypothetical protein